MATKKIISKPKKTLPTVTVETKKITAENSACCSPKTLCSGMKACKVIGTILILLNTLLLIVLLVNQSRTETMKVGGRENYSMLRQIFSTEGFKAQQKQQLEEALKAFTTPQANTQTQGLPQQPAQK